jgi:hypothetical protein
MQLTSVPTTDTVCVFCNHYPPGRSGISLPLAAADGEMFELSLLSTLVTFVRNHLICFADLHQVDVSGFGCRACLLECSLVGDLGYLRLSLMND